ncbi:MAG: hypothetical protein PUJ61_01145, partial [Spirochaetia bacterium]|nr:hypothetical protein [Spirochaetia bacterium]
ARNLLCKFSDCLNVVRSVGVHERSDVQKDAVDLVVRFFCLFRILWQGVVCGNKADVLGVTFLPNLRLPLLQNMTNLHQTPLKNLLHSKKSTQRRFLPLFNRTIYSIINSTR